MTSDELITLVSLSDLTEAHIVRNKLETQGIPCFINEKGLRKIKSTVQTIDIRVYLKDLDKALKLISDDAVETKDQDKE